MPAAPMNDTFPPTDAALASRLAAIDVAAYGHTRNHLDGAVTRLSPYLTHGFTTLPEAAARVPGAPLGPEHKLYGEFGWREFYQQVWEHLGEDIFEDVRAALPGVMYATRLNPDIREGATGLAVIDEAVRELYATGYLHNHARMWLASYVIHFRKVHWRAGADWMYGHLLDGDLASNHLSWQWVASTFSTKPYVFNAQNVATYAPAHWHVAGTPLDDSYEALDALARRNQSWPSPGGPGTREPAVLDRPSEAGSSAAIEAAAIELVHPWMLRPRGAPGVLRVGVIHLPFHRRFPWSARRWEFVMTRLAAITDRVFIGDLADLPRVIRATQITTEHTLNPGYREALDTIATTPPTPPARLIDWPAQTCLSYSKFWQQAHPGLKMFRR